MNFEVSLVEIHLTQHRVVRPPAKVHNNAMTVFSFDSTTNASPGDYDVSDRELQGKRVRIIGL